jgi:hypothetical protein
MLRWIARGLLWRVKRRLLWMIVTAFLFSPQLWHTAVNRVLPHVGELVTAGATALQARTSTPMAAGR